jgi:hypothetical protein
MKCSRGSSLHAMLDTMNVLISLAVMQTASRSSAYAAEIGGGDGGAGGASGGATQLQMFIRMDLSSGSTSLSPMVAVVAPTQAPLLPSPRVTWELPSTVGEQHAFQVNVTTGVSVQCPCILTYCTHAACKIELHETNANKHQAGTPMQLRSHAPEAA